MTAERAGRRRGADAAAATATGGRRRRRLRLRRRPVPRRPRAAAAQPADRRHRGDADRRRVLAGVADGGVFTFGDAVLPAGNPLRACSSPPPIVGATRGRDHGPGSRRCGRRRIQSRRGPGQEFRQRGRVDAPATRVGDRRDGLDRLLARRARRRAVRVRRRRRLFRQRHQRTRVHHRAGRGNHGGEQHRADRHRHQGRSSGEPMGRRCGAVLLGGGGHGSAFGPSKGTCDGYHGSVKPCPATKTVGVDCSGFVRWVYAIAYGSDVLGRDGTISQIKKVKKVSAPLPGDLVFFGPTVATTDHVGIYLGNGEMIDAYRDRHLRPGGPAERGEEPARLLAALSWRHGLAVLFTAPSAPAPPLLIPPAHSTCSSTCSFHLLIPGSSPAETRHPSRRSDRREGAATQHTDPDAETSMDSTFWVGLATKPDTYQLVNTLGTGGEGQVWRAILPLSDSGRRQVAIKVLPALGPEQDQDWNRFGHLLKSLAHRDWSASPRCSSGRGCTAVASSHRRCRPGTS